VRDNKDKKEGSTPDFPRVLNLFNEPETLIPVEKKIQKGNKQIGRYKTIPFYTKRNDFAKVLLALSELSHTHRSCIYTKADMQYKDGFGIVKGKNRSVIKTKTSIESEAVSDDVINAAEEALKKVNNNNESLSEVARQCRINLNSSGNGYLELVRGEVIGERFFNVYNHDFPNLLLEEPENAKENPTHVFISESWDENYIRTNEPVRLPLYPNFEFINGADRCIMHIKEYSVGRDYYGLPMFIGAKISTQLEYESDRHNLERFFSDFMPKFFAAFFAEGGMTKPEKEKFYDDFYDTYTKRGRDGGVSAMVQVFESENLKPYFHEFANTNSEGDFMNLKGGSKDAIFTAHRWHPVLAGVPVPSGLNDSKQLQNIFDIYNEISIKPNQKFDMSSFISPIFEMMSDWLRLPTVDHQLILETDSPISFYSALDVNKVITVDEGREYLGREKLGDDRGNFMVWEIGKQFNIQKEGGGLKDGSLDEEK
jgi:hypothetical protein